MPTYEYECDRCGTFEVEQKITDAPLQECPQPSSFAAHEPTPAPCGGRVRRLVAGTTSFVLKGSGWFKDGY